MAGLTFALALLTPGASPPLVADPFEAEPTIRVCIGQGVSSFELEIDGPWTITELDKPAVLARGARFEKGEVKAVKDALQCGKTPVREKKISVIPAKDEPVRFNGAKYPGRLDVIRLSTDRLLVVNAVPMDRYVEGVIGNEIGSGSRPAALEAQAVASRTYALACMESERQSRKRQYYDVFNDTRSQVYRGVAGVDAGVRKAVAATRGQALTWKGKVFTTFFHSTCGGQTEPGKDIFGDDCPALAGGPDPWCEKAALNDWDFKVKAETLRKTLAAETGEEVGAITAIIVDEARPSGRVIRLKISHTKKPEKPLKVRAVDLRDALGPDDLKSIWFTVEKKGDDWVFHGHGWGHGVGMCQEGAKRMASKGKTCAEILRQYYPGGQVKALWK
ncbi:MAG: SpoIID/LytB domain-containing protein [Planctomycetes bacterium]|nr:SpoIID/LytB domain-containing protein [Planctomycetota bacterium]